MKNVHVRQHRRFLRRRRSLLAAHTITADFPGGTLLAPLYREDETHDIRPADEAIGDDEYIFLSVESIYNPTESLQGALPPSDVYLFDAEQLIQKGALVRKCDVASSPDWDYLNDSGISGSDIREAANYDSNIKDALARLVKFVDEMTLQGDDAIEYLRKSPWKCKPELLVHKRLALSESVGVVSEEEFA